MSNKNTLGHKELDEDLDLAEEPATESGPVLKVPQKRGRKTNAERALLGVQEKLPVQLRGHDNNSERMQREEDRRFFEDFKGLLLKMKIPFFESQKGPAEWEALSDEQVYHALTQFQLPDGEPWRAEELKVHLPEVLSSWPKTYPHSFSHVKRADPDRLRALYEIAKILLAWSPSYPLSFLHVSSLLRLIEEQRIASIRGILGHMRLIPHGHDAEQIPDGIRRSYSNQVAEVANITSFPQDVQPLD